MANQKKKNSITGTETGSMFQVAIVGMAGIFPEAQNLVRYWENIMDEVNCIREVPSSRWSVEDYYDPDPSAPDKTYCKYGGFIPDIQFDPMEFGLPPNFLEVTDVSQLLSLIVARDALADAGYPEKGKEILDRTGVILGMVGMSSKVIQPLLNRLQYPVWEKVLRSSAVSEEEIPGIIEKMKLAYIAWNENAFPGAIGNVVAGRIANRFDLGGTNCIVDAACGSSLAAVSMAVSELALGRADMMITGGVDTDNSILTFLCFSKTPAFSRGDCLRAFSAESDGMLEGEGIGMLVLKRLADAEKDGDRIYAVIRGLGTSSDGYFKSIYAPRPSGQAKALRRAYQSAGYSPRTVGLIEAHGTGTNAGDPAEFEGLREVFSEGNPQKQYIALGSVKSQIGHTKATAGAASLIKASLALHHKVLPATINVSTPNPVMDIENSPFYLNTETRPWFRNTEGYPRRVGVSSFGFGGTNFHIAIEEYANDAVPFKRIRPSLFTVLLSAPIPDRLREVCKVTITKLEGEGAGNTLNQLDQEAHVNTIPADHARLGFLAESIEDARDKLCECLRLMDSHKDQETWSHPKGIFFRSSGVNPEGKTVALFPGQGSQYVNMGKNLAINFPPFREAFENADAEVVKNGREALTKVVYPLPVFSEEERNAQQETLTATENAQPAIGTFSLGLFNMLKTAGFKANFFAGHSFGELTALWAGGALDDDAFIRLAIIRGEAMSTHASSGKDTGGMAAVKGDVAKIRELLKDHPDVQIANFNSPTQVVLAGATQGIQDIKPVVEKAGMSVYPLEVSAAFHTAFVGHAKEPFTAAIKKETFKKPSGKVYANTTSQPYADNPQLIIQTLSDHILNPVRFQEEIENIYNAGGTIFIEIGPKNVLSNLVKDILNGKPHEIITLNPNSRGDSDLQFQQAVLQMRVLGFGLTNIDPYRTYKEYKAPTASKVAVTMNGGLYTTEATRRKFEEAIKTKSNGSRLEVNSQNDDHRKTAVSRFMAEQWVEKSQNTNIPPQQKTSPKGLDVTPMLSNAVDIESLIERLQDHQSEILKAHVQFLQNDNASKTTLQDIAKLEISMLSGQNDNEGKPTDERTFSLIEKQAELISSQHKATTNAHQEYIKTQTAFMQQYADLIKGLMGSGMLHQSVGISSIEQVFENNTSDIQVEAEKPSPMPEIVLPFTEHKSAAVVGYDTGELSQSFLTIVSEKTGYPVDMLELSMDMEADLGIDSIKRVEVLGAVQEKYPDLPSISTEELVELRTLEQVIGAFKVDKVSNLKTEPTQGTAASVKLEADEEMPKDAQIPEAEIQNVFLEIVSEKTGYPTDMLELTMDMEADLGIDSIKRVEILGAVQEKYPDLPSISAEELVELRSLEQVISKFSSNKVEIAEKSSENNPVVQAEKNETAAQKQDSIAIYPLSIKSLPKPDQVEFDYPEASTAIITDVADGITKVLADFLYQKGLKVVVVHIGKSGKSQSSGSSKGIKHLYLESADESSVQAIMENVIAENRKIVAFVHLEPSRKDNGKDLINISDENAESLKSVFLMARHLKAPLTASATETRPAFMTVTQMDGQFGFNGYKGGDPLPGGFAGLTKSLRLEWGNVFCRALDFHPEMDAQKVVERINEELHDADLRLTEVGYTPEGRFTVALEDES